MRRSIYRMIKEFRMFWKNYLFQSLFATIGVFIVILCLRLQEAVIISSIGSTVFVVFAMPKSIVANPRNIIGGHLIGILCGALFTLIPHSSFLSSAAVYSLAVGASIFIMVVTDIEHPPASATALGVALTGFSPKVAITVLVSTVILALIHCCFKRYLKDLV